MSGLRQYTPLITESALAICIFLLSIYNLQREENKSFFPFILCLVLICYTDSECYFDLFYIETNTYIVKTVLCLKMLHILVSYPTT